MDATIGARLKWNIVFFRGHSIRIGCRRGAGGRTLPWGWRIIAASAGWSTLRASLAFAKESEALQDNTEATALLVGLFILPLVQLEAAFNEYGTTAL